MFGCFSSKLKCQGICRLAKRVRDQSLSIQNPRCQVVACWYIPTRKAKKTKLCSLCWQDAQVTRNARLAETTFASLPDVLAVVIACYCMFCKWLLHVLLQLFEWQNRIGVMDSMESHCRPRWLCCWDPVAKICSGAFRKSRPGKADSESTDAE